MGKSRCKSNIKTIHRFLNATDGNWRNSFYIHCAVCRYEKEPNCGDFLFVPQPDGRPFLLPIHEAETAFGLIDRGDCLGQMSNVMFGELYKKWLQKACPCSGELCPFIHLKFQDMSKLC